MSTTPSPVAATTPPAAIPSTLSKDWAWVTSHLITIAILAGLGVFGFQKVESLTEAHEAKEAALYSSLSAAQVAQNQTLENQLKTDEANWATIQSQLLAQNSQLTQEITQKNQQLALQVKSDANLDTQDAAARLAQQTQASAGEVTATGSGITIDLPTTRRVVSDLDTLLATQSDLASTQTQLSNETTIAANTQKDDDDQKKLVSGLTTQIADDSKACDARVSAAKAGAKKSGIKGFFYGVAVVGLALLGHSL
jgi:hypothetical protein